MSSEPRPSSSASRGCPACRAFLRPRHLLYADEYLLLVPLVLVEAVLTWLLITQNAHMLSPLIDYVIRDMGFSGVMLYNLLIVALVVILAEDVGRRRPSSGRRVVAAAMFLLTLPMVAAAVQLIGTL